MPNEKLYRKKGRRYEPVGYEHTGFPAEGVWLVTQGKNYRSERLFMRIGDAPSVMTLAAFERHRDAIARAVSQVQNWTSRSPDDMAAEVIKAVAKAEEEGS